MPKRPKWDYSLSQSELEKREKEIFSKWLNEIYTKYPRDQLNYFEHNLEVI